MAHREAGGVLHAYVAVSKPQDELAAIDFTDVAAAKTRVVAELAGWAPALTALITDGETPPVLRSLHQLPSGHRWPRVAGVPLLGDAAHLGPPNGEGANLAMLDGAEARPSHRRAPQRRRSRRRRLRASALPAQRSRGDRSRARLRRGLRQGHAPQLARDVRRSAHPDRAGRPGPRRVTVRLCAYR